MDPFVSGLDAIEDNGLLSSLEVRGEPTLDVGMEWSGENLLQQFVMIDRVESTGKI